MAVVLLANVFFWGVGKCPNLGGVNVRILGVVNVRLANSLTPTGAAKTLRVLKVWTENIFIECGPYSTWSWIFEKILLLRSMRFHA